MSLFSSSAEPLPLALPDGALWYWPELPLPLARAEVFARLRAETPWEQRHIVLFGRRHAQPRLTAWYGDVPYTYSGLTLEPRPWTALLAALRATVQEATGRAFNSVLLNYYRDGRDSMGWHADDEPELGPEPAIASLSLGQPRTFKLRHRNTGERRALALADGSLLLMAGRTQAHWLHALPRTAKPVGGRINLTFRFLC
jgi:alkylated DNA repair dioxygenase AlkB